MTSPDRQEPKTISRREAIELIAGAALTLILAACAEKSEKEEPPTATRVPIGSVITTITTTVQEVTPSLKGPSIKEQIEAEAKAALGEPVGSFKAAPNYPQPFIPNGWGPKTLGSNEVYGLRFLSVEQLPEVVVNDFDTSTLWRLPLANAEGMIVHESEGVAFELDAEAIEAAKLMSQVDLPYLPEFEMKLDPDKPPTSGAEVRFVEELERLDFEPTGSMELYDFRRYCMEGGSSSMFPVELAQWQETAPDIGFLVAVSPHPDQNQFPLAVELTHLYQDPEDWEKIIGFTSFQINNQDLFYLGNPGRKEVEGFYTWSKGGIFLYNDRGQLKYLLIEEKR